MSDNQSENSHEWGKAPWGEQVSSIPKEYMNVDHDFGFTATDDPFKAEQQALSEVEDLHDRLDQLERAIMPLLVNLMKNPEKEHIKWPNRKEQIEAFITKVLKLTRG